MQKDIQGIPTSTIRLEKFRFPIQVAIGFFLLAGLLGAIMRFIYLEEVPFLDYKYVLHAHSHVAMLGWGFTALASILVFRFLSHVALRRVYKNAFWGNIIAGIGMFFAFLYQGYGAVSIAFSTLHMLVAYYFAWHFLQDIQNLPKTNAVKFAKWAIYLMVLSTLGLWAIAPVSILLGKLHPLYFASIQFFLHMQFNGWFTFGILALVFKHSEIHGREVQLPKGTFLILLLSLVLTYSLSITWSTPEDFLFYLNSGGIILQIIAFLLLTIGFYKTAAFPFQWRSLAGWLLQTGLLSLALKVIVQGAVAVPFIAKVSYMIRNFVIGFIHLTMLGAFSLSLIAFIIHSGLLPRNPLASTGYRFLLLGFVLTEAILFLQGILLWAGDGYFANYDAIIFGATALLPIALLLVFIASLQRKKIVIT